jgi:hypothetical protein
MTFDGMMVIICYWSHPISPNSTEKPMSKSGNMVGWQ